MNPYIYSMREIFDHIRNHTYMTSIKLKEHWTLSLPLVHIWQLIYTEKLMQHPLCILFADARAPHPHPLWTSYNYGPQCHNAH